MLILLYVFYALVIEQILLGGYSLWQGLRWLQTAQRRAASHAGFFAPRVALFCPVKGAEPGFEQNISALLAFDYPDYEIFFAMASNDDPARKIIERLSGGTRRKVHVVIAGRPENCGEKVHNLRAAVLQAGQEFDTFVFVDSDGRPPRNWLSRLVASLENPSIGAVTTFRWLFPQAGGFWSALASAWNAPAATFLGEHHENFCWGGGTAIRRERFEYCNALEFWKGSVSDDYSLTHALRQAGLSIVFAPECIVPSVFDCDMAGLFEFTNRQIKITRVYESKLWSLGGLAHAAYCLSIVLGIVLFVVDTIADAPAIHLLLLALVPPMLSMGRGVLRLAAIIDVLPEWKTRLLAGAWIWTFLAALAPFLALWNSLVALFSKQIRWRGIRYELISPTETRILVR